MGRAVVVLAVCPSHSEVEIHPVQGRNLATGR